MDSKEIRDLFATHGVSLGRKDVWDIKGKPVILHSSLERLAAKIGISWDPPVIARQTDNEVVILARGTRKDSISEWSYGEVKIGTGDAAVPGANYMIKGKQPGYPWAMAEKRAKDRVIIKLAGMHGAYSEEEAEDFQSRNADAGSTRNSRVANDDNQGSEDEGRNDAAEERNEVAQDTQERQQQPDPQSDASGPSEGSGEASSDKAPANDDDSDEVAALRNAISKARTIKAVTEVMLHAKTKALLDKQTETKRVELREAGKSRLKALGWPEKGGQEGAKVA